MRSFYVFIIILSASTFLLTCSSSDDDNADDTTNTGTDTGNGGGEGEDQDASETTACTTNDDCQEGQICTGGICQQKECEVDADCPSGKICRSNVCEDKPVGQKCDTDAQCDTATERCVNSQCTTVECTTNEKCPSGKICDQQTWTCVEGGAGEGSLCESDAGCQTPLKCVSGVCTKTCQADSECATGMKCLPAGDFGVSTCQESGGCEVDSQCPAETPKCENGQCVADTGCDGDNECAEPTPKCNVSTRVCVECMLSADCAMGQLCENNVCTGETDAGTTDGSINIGDGGPATPCQLSSDCTDSVKNVCDPSTKTCVDCLSDYDCNAGQCCDVNKKSCTTGGTCGNADAGEDVGSGAGQYCDSCVKDSDCDQSQGLKCLQGMPMMGSLVCVTTSEEAMNCLFDMDGGTGDSGFPFP